MIYQVQNCTERKLDGFFSGIILAGHLVNYVKDNEILKALSLQNSVIMLACF